MFSEADILFPAPKTPSRERVPRTLIIGWVNVSHLFYNPYRVKGAVLPCRG